MAEGVLSRWVVPITADTTGLKKELSNLRTEARALGTLSRGMAQVAATLTKAVVAPIVAMGTMGVKKFLQTTDFGAQSLRKELKGLTDSWNQMLARIGSTIYKSGELSKVIAGLKKIFDNITVKDILRVMEVGKWAAITAIIFKVGGMFTGWLSTILKIQIALKSLSMPIGAPTAGSTMAQAMGTSVGAAGAAGLGVGVGGGIETAAEYLAKKELKNTKKWLDLLNANSNLKLERPEVFAQAQKKFNDHMASMQKTIAGGTAVGTIGIFKNVLKGLGSIALLFAKIGVAISAIFGFVQGVTGQKEGLMSGLDAILWIFKKLFGVIEIIFQGFHRLFFVIGAFIRKLFTGNKNEYLEQTSSSAKSFGKTVAGFLGKLEPDATKASKQLEEEWNRIHPDKPLGQARGGAPGIEVAEDKKFDFGSKYMGVAASMDLNKVFQEMALENQTISIMNKQTDYLKQIVDNTAVTPSYEQAHWAGGDLVPSVYKDSYSLI